MADKAKMKSVVFEDVRIGFRNFSGKEGQYNREGDRNFVVFLDPETAEAMMEDGYNVKHLKPRDEDEDPQAYLQVSVNFKGRPPKVVMVTSRGKNPLGEEEVEVLDWVDIKMVDLIIRPYQWEVNGKSGVKAYLQSIFITIEEDELELKYVDVPDSAQNAIGYEDMGEVLEIEA